MTNIIIVMYCGLDLSYITGCAIVEGIGGDIGAYYAGYYLCLVNRASGAGRPRERLRKREIWGQLCTVRTKLCVGVPGGLWGLTGFE